METKYVAKSSKTKPNCIRKGQQLMYQGISAIRSGQNTVEVTVKELTPVIQEFLDHKPYVTSN